MFQSFVQIICHHQEAACGLAQAGFIEQDGIPKSLHSRHRYSGEGVVDRIQHLFG